MTYKIAVRRFSTQTLHPDSCESISDLRRYLRLLASLLVLCFCFGGEALAQNVQYTNKATDLGLRGTQRVNPITRAVELQIPLGHYRGRGIDLPVTLSYSSKVWEVTYQGYNPGAPPPHGGIQPFTIVTADYAKRSVAGWTSGIGFPVIDSQVGNQIYDANGNPNVSGVCTFGCYLVDRKLIWMPDGSGHELRASDQPRIYTDPAPDNYYSVDGARMRYQASTQTLYLADGSQYLFATSKYIDRNGNTLNYVGGWRDTLDRTINNPLPYNVGQGPLSPTDQTYTLPGVGNTSISYTFKWRNLADVLTTPEPLRYVADGGCPPGLGAFSPYLFQYDNASRTCFGNAGVQFNPVVLSQIVLPNGQTYTFTYDIFGAIDKVVLPSGGYEKYEYAYTGGISSPVNFKFVYAQGNRGVTRHIVSPSGSGTDEIVSVYAGGGNFVSNTLPDGSRKETYVWTDAGSNWGYSLDSSRAGKPFDERVYSSSGQMLRRKLTDWAMTPSNATGNPGAAQNANRNARVVREVELILDTGGNALAKTRTYSYDTTYQYSVGLEQTTVNEFDYVEVDQTTAQTLAIGSLSAIPNGTPLRTTEFDYLTGDNNYRSRNILGLVTATRIKNGAGTIVAQTSNTYDEAGFPLLTYPSVLNWTDPATTFRGNVTTMTTWLNFNGSTLSSFPQGTYLASHTQYDQCGSVRKTWDAKDVSLTNPTLIDYSNTYHRAYPTTATSADPDGAGTLTPLVTSTEYDFSTGFVTASVDANGQRTTFTYNDPLNRLTQTIRAATDPVAKSQTTHIYNDASRTVTTTSDLTAYNDNLLKTVALYDTLGRLIETQTYESPSSYISRQQQYDQLGRVFKISNPFRPLQGETALWTTSQFDDLGRLLSVTSPDNAVSSTSYSGNTVTLTDQIGKQRKNVIDPLGRTKQIYEAPNDPSYNYLTSYEYDALDNLVKVTQGTQLRYFMYDSLKRLIRSRNVEQATNLSLNLTDPGTLNVNWSIGYQYDSNGNLTQKTEPRGVVATYTYDGLDRNLSITYSNDSASTPAVTLTYDTATNGKGRLRQIQTANTSRTTIDSYDALGRRLSQQQQFYVSGAWGPSYTAQRAYNLAGGVSSQTYPSNRVVNYIYDNAGRVTSFSGSLGDGTTRTYSNESIYSPFGTLAKEKFGTTTPIYNKLFYNNRGQLAEIRESTTYTGPSDTTADRGAIVNHYSELCSGKCTPTSTMTDNNGNLRKQEILIPNVTTKLQRFEYDSLNRLSLVKEELTGVEQWKQQFTYDRWGNRTINLGVTYGVAEKDFTVNTNNNRLEVPVGQSGSMSYDNAGNLTNDTYTGAGARTYDAENRIISAWGGNNQAQLYVYDGIGQRIKRTVDGGQTWQVYGFDGELLAEYAASGAANSPQKEYGYRNGQLLVTLDAGATLNGYSNRRTITIDHNKVPNADQSNFPVLITGTYSYLATQANGGNVQNANGYDVIFTSDSGCTTKLNYEVEAYNSANGSVIYWVRVPLLSHTTDTTIYLCYGNSAITTDQSNKAGVWDSNYKAVYHLKDQTANTTVLDSTANASNGVNAANTSLKSVSGKFGQALTYNGSSDSTATGVTQTSSFTWECWFKLTDWTTTPGSSNYSTLMSGTYSTGGALLMLSKDFTWMVQFAPDNVGGVTSGTGSIAPGVWHHAAYTRTGNNGTYALYFDGEFKGQVASGTNNTTSTITLATRADFVSQALNGLLDETRISNVARSANWIKTQYNNQNSPATFYTISAATAGTSDVRWLVADQLGTPRIVFDQTGSLANVKRHDYLPFGEELFAPTGGRSTAQGYSADGVRQQFTSKERDTETGLDYFGARYYSSVQGRFLSVDPENAGAAVPRPQSWNGYAYSLNNPLRFIDPDGLRWAQIELAGGGILYQWFDDEKKDANGKTEYDRAIEAGFSPVDFDESKDFSYATGIFAPGETITSVTLRPDGSFKVSKHVVTIFEWYLVYDAVRRVEQEKNLWPSASYRLMWELVRSILEADPDISFDVPEVPAPAVSTKPKPAGGLYTDVTDKVHGKLPKTVPKNWTREELRDTADALKKSIQTRKAEQIRLGEDGPHRLRINQEERLLRQIEKKLSGT